MYTLNYLQFQTLRKDPTKYWNKSYLNSANKNDILNMAVKAMFKNPKTFSDTFVTPIDVTKEDPKAILMIETLSNMLYDFLKRNGEIEEDVLTEFNLKARKVAGLSSDYVPTDAITKYGEYLMIKDDRIQISQSVENEAFNYAKRIKTLLQHTGEESETLYPGFDESPIKNIVNGPVTEIWLRPTIRVDVKIFDEARNRGTDLAIDEQPDYIAYIPEKKEAYITNLYVCDNITEFPDLFKQQNMGQLAEFQHMVLGKIFKTCKYSYLVMDPARKYVFDIVEIKDLTEELKKALFTLSKGSHLPYEYDKKEITL